jgi:pantetheine-phosphate adenylyltransferase
MTKAIYAGSFDPFTNGHFDIIERALLFCEKLVIAIGINPLKKTMFSEEERLDQIKQAIDTKWGSLTAKPLRFWHRNHIQVASFQGLLVDYAKECGATILVRGIRNASDFEYENSLALINKVLAPTIETVFLPTTPELAIVSSSMIKEIAKCGGDISKFAPPNIVDAVKAQFGFVKVSDKDTCRYMSCKNKCLPNLVMCKEHQPYPLGH